MEYLSLFIFGVFLSSVYILDRIRSKKKTLSKITKISDKKLGEMLLSIDPRKFEILCYELIKASSEYKKVELTPAGADGGKDIIAKDRRNKKVYIECKRYTNRATSSEGYMIGRVILQKFVGAMVADQVYRGIIMTTGNTHTNAKKYIMKLHINTPYKIEILGMNDIIKLIRQHQENINLSTILNIR